MKSPSRICFCVSECENTIGAYFSESITETCRVQLDSARRRLGGGQPRDLASIPPEAETTSLFKARLNIILKGFAKGMLGLRGNRGWDGVEWGWGWDIAALTGAACLYVTPYYTSPTIYLRT